MKEIKRTVLGGGKRLRPAFIYWGYQAAEESKKFPNRKQIDSSMAAEVQYACLSLELFHTFALIHDDIIDNSETRRGKLSSWKKLGVNQAILVGDLAFQLAEELFSSISNKKALALYNLQKWEVVCGQYLDTKKIDNEKLITKNGNLKSKILSEKDVKGIMELKSGRYTVARPLQIGAVLAGAGEKTLKKLFNYGVNLGIAFQIRDDILNIFGDREETGKPVGDDISEAKKTLLIAKLLKAQKHNPELKTFWSLYGCARTLNKKELLLIQKIFRQSGVLKDCEQEMVKLANKAKKIMAAINWKKKSKPYLIEIADFIINRKS